MDPRFNTIPEINVPRNARGSSRVSSNESEDSIGKLVDVEKIVARRNIRTSIFTIEIETAAREGEDKGKGGRAIKTRKRRRVNEGERLWRGKFVNEDESQFSGDFTRRRVFLNLPHSRACLLLRTHTKKIQLYKIIIQYTYFRR